jgi:bifunctional pyridoxal-dependent enzyme with beta-cystathionase and maltose regulon repressor activities
LWMDCRNIVKKDAARFFLEGNVHTHDGVHFGRDYAGFARLNLACPRGQLDRALDLMRRRVCP